MGIGFQVVYDILKDTVILKVCTSLQLNRNLSRKWQAIPSDNLCLKITVSSSYNGNLPNVLINEGGLRWNE